MRSTSKQLLNVLTKPCGEAMRITPKNWRSFQHYKDRNPPWIKLHRGLLNDYSFACLPLASKALAPCLWLLAAEHDDGIIDASVEEIAFRVRMTNAEVSEGLNALISKGFFLSDSEVLADCKQVATLEIETETYSKETETYRKEGEAKKLISSKKPRVTSSAEFDKFWMVYPRKVNKGLAMKAWEKAASKAAPALIIAAVEAWKVSVDFPDPDFIPHASSWLNGERWTDELSDRKQVVTQAEREAFMAEHRRKMMELSNGSGIEPVGSGSLNLHEDDSTRSEIPWI